MIAVAFDEKSRFVPGSTVVSRLVGSDLAILDFKTGVLYSTSGIGPKVWQLLAASEPFGRVANWAKSFRK